MTFNGFSRRDKPTYLPETFFSELLPLIDDLAELKLTLFCMWALQQREGRYRYLTEADFSGDAGLMAGLRAAAPEDADPADVLAAALERAIARGTLLRAEISRSDGAKQALYLMNTERGREAAEAISNGDYDVTDADQVAILPPRPNIYRLYEQEIGVLTPMIADGLKDLERDYPAVWLPEAIKVAAEKQAKNLQFIRAVLERWRKEGKTDDEIIRRQEPVGDTGEGRRFISGEYADYIDH
jgi:DnaD/phage-associated family protein